MKAYIHLCKEMNLCKEMTQGHLIHKPISDSLPCSPRVLLLESRSTDVMSLGLQVQGCLLPLLVAQLWALCLGRRHPGGNIQLELSSVISQAET